MPWSKVSLSSFAAHILILSLVFIVAVPHFVYADAPTGQASDQSAALAEPPHPSSNSFETIPLPAKTEAEPPADMSPATFLLVGGLGLGLVGGVSMMVLRMGPDK
ncbi:MAG TPA: hypothetical protein PKE64_21765 [Anaerolineae bacterium]|nr:hypothetical protein [Anaerolineae bacterium]HMR66650.1 hypothetical protein [Anaerolineae bacterium]